MQEKEKSIIPTKSTGKNQSVTKQNGREKTKRDSGQTGTPGTTELSTQSEVSNSQAVSVIDPSMDLRDHLATLRMASSESMNYIDSTTTRLHELMISVGESLKTNEHRAWANDNVLAVKQTVDISRQLNNTMRLKLDTVKMLHKISRDISFEDTRKTK